jgi:hypothetical protein
MRSIILVGLILLAWVYLVRPLSADEPKSPTPAEEFRALVKAQQQDQEELSKEYNAAKSDEDRQRVLKEFSTRTSPNYYAEKFLALIRNHPKDPVALEIFRRMIAQMGFAPETNQAAELVARHWIEDEKLTDVCQTLYHHSCDTGDAFLREAIDKNPHRTVQGYARFDLALSLKRRADRMANFPPMDRDPFEREAEQLLQHVIAKYADLKHITTLGREAEKELFELQNLAIGKIAPELQGEDLDGKPMMLSDYRGKVVLLDFWGSW